MMRLFVAGHRGLVGRALCRQLAGRRDCQVITAPRGALDLRDQAAVAQFFTRHRIDAVILAAARVGGIAANAAAPGGFLYDNLMIQTNVLHQAFLAQVPRLLFLGSSCIYPKHAPQPIPEGALMSGPLEPTNAAYATAKIAGVQMCTAYHQEYGCDFRAVMPPNLYGPGDRFDDKVSHVIPALMQRMHQAKRSGAPEVAIWGSGQALREFLYVDDLAEACLTLLDLPPEQFSALVPEGTRHLNIPGQAEMSIRTLAEQIAQTVGYRGALRFDSSRPDGTPRKALCGAQMAPLGWRPRTSLAEGLGETYAWYLDRLHHDAPLEAYAA